jgi:TRAP-type transport system periplasmic protein
MSVQFRIIAAVLALALVLAAAPAAAQTTLRASHQWPGGIGDLRDEVVQMIARDVAGAGVGIEIRVYPGEALYRARDQWSALVRGQLDITALPLDYAAGRHPQFSATLMPGLVKDHTHTLRLNASPFMDEIRRVILDAGAIVLADAWVAGGFVSTKNCILAPDDIRGQVTRAAGPAFERMLAGAGASIASMPSSEIYTAMQTGVLDAASTSSASFVSFRLHEQARCFTAPGEHALWFMYQPIMISRRSWDRLSPAQQGALSAAGRRAGEHFYEQAQTLEALAEQTFRDAGVEVVHMSAAQAAQWRELAGRTAYRHFADNVRGGGALIEAALAVE